MAEEDKPGDNDENQGESTTKKTSPQPGSSPMIWIVSAIVLLLAYLIFRPEPVGQPKDVSQDHLGQSMKIG